MLLTRRETFSLLPILVPKSNEARLEDKVDVLRKAMVGMLEAMQALNDRQEMIMKVSDNNAIAVQKRLAALEAEIFPSSEQGDESYG